MFIEQKPKNSPERVIKVVMTPEEAEVIWMALANSVHPSPTSERLRRLLWKQLPE